MHPTVPQPEYRIMHDDMILSRTLDTQWDLDFYRTQPEYAFYPSLWANGLGSFCVAQRVEGDTLEDWVLMEIP